MTITPQVSVITSVYNGKPYLRRCVISVLEQTFTDFEFIIVNDGSTDDSLDLLRDYAAADSRIRVIDQQNSGLTRALIRGCAEARGTYIARQDADDWSHPERLERQVALLEQHPEVSLVSCFTEFVGPEGEELRIVARHDSPQEATARLRTSNVRELQGVSHHGSTLFRRADYERAGGYRQEFYFAQDLDLWMRLTDIGLLSFVPQVLYHARFAPASISGDFAGAQRELAKIIVRLRDIRERGGDEAPLLACAARIRPGANGRSRPNNAGGDYFIGRLLQQRGDPRAKKYLRQAVAANPFHLRARVALVLQTLCGR